MANKLFLMQQYFTTKMQEVQ